jgi:hypothetical protein
MWCLIRAETSEVRTKFAKALQLLKAYQQRMASMQVTLYAIPCLCDPMTPFFLIQVVSA